MCQQAARRRQDCSRAVGTHSCPGFVPMPTADSHSDARRGMGVPAPAGVFRCLAARTLPQRGGAQ